METDRNHKYFFIIRYIVNIDTANVGLGKLLYKNDNTCI